MGHKILVCGDFISEYTDLKSWMLDFSLADLLSNKHGLGPRTYKRSKNCLIDCC